MRRRRVVVGLLALTLAGLALGWWLWPRSAINRQNAASIAVGIGRKEVETLLGGPERDDSSGIRVGEEGLQRDGEARGYIDLFVFINNRHSAYWFGNEVFVRVQFDEHEAVTEYETLAVCRPPGWPWQLFLRWIGR